MIIHFHEYFSDLPKGFEAKSEAEAPKPSKGTDFR